jgi:hypothetical protein
MPGLDLDGWNMATIVFFVVAAVAATAVGVSQFIIIRLQRASEAKTRREFERYKLGVAAKVEEARKEGVEAGRAAGNALARTADLERQAEQLRKETAEANARASQSQLALERFKQPRLLSEQQLSTIAGKLKQFAGTRFDAAVLPGDPEAIIFLSFITATLESAGWIWVEWNPPNGPLAMAYSFGGKPNIGQLGSLGVSLQVNPAHDAALSAPANALEAALVAEGFEANLDITDNASIPNKDTVHITVGKKSR